jgi:hypothetical protein
MANSRAQIALEFVVVYSFVLVVFLVFFGVITTERASTLSQQQYSALQLQAQNIASYINQGLYNGNGYSATIPLAGAIGLTQYNVTVSSTGVVIVSMKIGSQVLTAYAHSNAKNLVINGTPLSSSANGIDLYLIPAYTGYIKVSNRNGVIYLNQNPPSTQAQPSYIQMQTMADVKSGIFGSVYSNVGTSLLPFNGGSFTILGWVYWPVGTDLASGDWGYAWAGPATGDEGFGIFSRNDQWYLNFFADDLSCANGPSTGTWYQFGAQFNATTKFRSIIVNGTQDCIKNSAGTLDVPSPYYLQIGNASGTWDKGAYMGGRIANVQLYSANLSASQISQLYQEGIGGAPVNTSSLVAWWPLNGDSLDYSGNGNAGAASPEVSYNSVTQLRLKILNPSSAPVPDAEVGISSTYGTLVGPSASYNTFTTDSSGNIEALVTSNSFYSGTVNITATAFNGNSSTLNYLVDWLPLAQGFGSQIPNFGSDNVGPGSFTGAAWAPMPMNRSAFYTASFPGNPSGTTGNSIQNGYVSIPYSTAYNEIAINSSFTAVGWVYFKGASGQCQGMISDINANNIGFEIDPNFCDTPSVVCPARVNADCLYVMTLSTYPIRYPDPCSDTGGPELCPDTTNVPSGRWEMVTGEAQNQTGRYAIYLNDTPYVTSPFSDQGAGAAIVSNSPIYIGNDAWSPGGIATFNGMIQNVQLYSSYLSRQQIGVLYREGINGAPISGAGLVGWWPLDGNANDYSWNHNNGTVVYNVTYANTLYSPAATNPNLVAKFNGASSNIQFSTGLPSGLCSYSELAWSYMSGNIPSVVGNPNQYETVFSTTGASSGVYVEYNSISILYGINTVTIGLPGGTYHPGQYIGRWLMPAVVVNNGYATVYLNNQEVDSNVNVGCGNAGSSAGIGTYLGFPNAAFNGSISDMQVYDTALTQTQISQLYAQGPLPLYKETKVSFG